MNTELRLAAVARMLKTLIADIEVTAPSIISLHAILQRLDHAVAVAEGRADA
jgi:hypothetical protein